MVKKILVLVSIIIIAGAFVVFRGDNEEVLITTFEECVSAGNPVMESYPRQCRSGGQAFIENIGNELEKMDMIRINSPRPNEKIESPLSISGEAVRGWFFEGDFPVVLIDGDGKIIAEGFVSAQGEWMSEEFVPFLGELEFEKPEFDNRGTLILEKDNPSNTLEDDDVLEVPISF